MVSFYGFPAAASFHAFQTRPYLGKLLSIVAFDDKYEKGNFLNVVIMYNAVQCAAYVS